MLQLRRTEKLACGSSVRLRAFDLQPLCPSRLALSGSQCGFELVSGRENADSGKRRKLAGGSVDSVWLRLSTNVRVSRYDDHHGKRCGRIITQVIYMLRR